MTAEQTPFEATAPAAAATSPRTGQKLLNATQPFLKENRAQSWIHLFVALAVTAGFWAVSVFFTPLTQLLGSSIAAMFSATILGQAVALTIRVAAGLFAGFTIVRLFIIYHDFMHLALFRKSKVAQAILYVYGILVMTPPRAWRESHNYHHANNAKIVGSHVGSYAMVTKAMWAKMSTKERLMYKAIRHPINILVGYFTIFMLGMCVSPFLRNPKKNWDSALALVVNWGLTGFLCWRFGFATFFFALFWPLAVATALGAYLFYIQHNFPGIQVQGRHEWSYTKAALESSSYLKTGPVMQWFTGNIGFHHVHHLNPAIPFYRLPEAMAGVPELQDPPTITFRWSDIVACFRLKVWDPESRHMVGYPDDEADGHVATAE
jgi:acyl-lipid omega-6 desaturase (Delta-12 desaturase)